MKSLLTPLNRGVFALGVVGCLTFPLSVALGQTNCVATPNGLVGWWPAEGSAIDVANGDNGTGSAVTYAPGEVGQAFNYDGINTSIVVPASSNLTVQSL